MYKIWKYFPKEIRKKVVDETYIGYETLKGLGLEIKLNKDGYCPLGIALENLALHKGKNLLNKTPSYYSVVEIFKELSIEVEDQEDLERKARVFTNNWDDGKITDLEKAVGVKR